MGSALHTGVLRDTILYTPAPSVEAAYLPHLLQWVEAGGRVFFYGPMDDAAPEVLDLLHLQLKEPLEGDLHLAWEPGTATHTDGQYADRTLRHVGITSGGGIREVLRSGSTAVELVASVRKGDALRTYAVTARDRRIAWVRGTLPFDIGGGERIQSHSLSEHINGARIPRMVLGLLGWEIDYRLRAADQRDPQLFISRHRNAFLVSGYKPDNTVEMALRFPDGAPIFVGDDTVLEDGRALYHLDKSFHKTCRACVAQCSGLITCRKTLNLEFTELEIAISGLQEALVTLYLPVDKIEGALIRTRDSQAFDVQAHRVGDKVVISDVSGTLLVRW